MLFWKKNVGIIDYFLIDSGLPWRQPKKTFWTYRQKFPLINSDYIWHYEDEDTNEESMPFIIHSKELIKTFTDYDAERREFNKRWKNRRRPKLNFINR